MGFITARERNEDKDGLFQAVNLKKKEGRFRKPRFPGTENEPRHTQCRARRLKSKTGSARPSTGRCTAAPAAVTARFKAVHLRGRPTRPPRQRPRSRPLPWRLGPAVSGQKGRVRAAGGPGGRQVTRSDRRQPLTNAKSREPRGASAHARLGHGPRAVRPGRWAQGSAVRRRRDPPTPPAPGNRLHALRRRGESGIRCARRPGPRTARP